ncbi:MAG: DUF711 family protein [Candidatus Pacebacteria bacterium]|nr:DUF711 family protein [Candidatus Paceibacterota bacterium]
MSNKVIRTVCYFTKNSNKDTLNKLLQKSNILESKDYEIQTKRICTSEMNIGELGGKINEKYIWLNVGSLKLREANNQLNDFLGTNDVSFNMDLTDVKITKEHVDILYKIINGNSAKTFNFCYVFNNSLSSPFFPAGCYKEEGFSVGLQLTDLSESCDTLEEWFDEIKKVFNELTILFKKDKEFLGIDSSIAPVFNGKSSLIDFIKKIGYEFDYSVLSDNYLKITNFIKKQNPQPIGLCGLMFPCLEDFGLTEEYEKGNFSIERNLFLSLHSGLGIDTYPIGIDQNKERILNILKTVQGLSNKYKKPLSCRFVSDGKAKIGDMTNFKNEYLKDVIIRKI